MGGVAGGQQGGTPELQVAGDPLVAHLRTYLEEPKAQAKQPSSARSVPTAETENVERIQGDTVNADHWHISVRFGPEVLRNGMDPLSFIRYLGTLGNITAI